MTRRPGSPRWVIRSTVVAVVLALSAPAHAQGPDWAPPQNLESVPGTSPSLNTSYLDGCPAQSPDGRHLYMASTRPGGLGGIDIWVARRPRPDAPWGTPRNLGRPVNSGADDFCPTPVGRSLLFFVTSRQGGCGGPDIYLTRNSRRGWTRPRNLGCQVNSSAGEAGPSLVREGSTQALYFSSNRPGGFAPEDGTPADSDIYRSELIGGQFTAAALVPGLNTASDDARPNVRQDGLELFLDSNRPGTLGGPDLYVATRTSVNEAWSDPVNLGPTVNSSSAETRPWISADGRTLYFGSNRPGSEPDPVSGSPSSDLYFTTRDELR